MRQILFALILTGTVWGQTMTEAGAVMAGTSVGSAAGKKISEGVNKTLKKTGGILDTAAKAGAKQTKAAPAPSAPAKPMLEVSAGVPKGEVYNVPPPPPPKRRSTARTEPPRQVSAPIVMAAVVPDAEPEPPKNVDLSVVAPGMSREKLLELGVPSARITMFEDNHLVEIFQYRNATLASGTVRLRDGAVVGVQPRL